MCNKHVNSERVYIMIDEYQISFELKNEKGECYTFKTLKGDGAKTFRDYLYKDDRKLFGITQRNMLLSNKETDNNAAYLMEKYEIDLFSMSDLEIQQIGLERTKINKPHTNSFVGTPK